MPKDGQRGAQKLHRDVLPGDSHVTAMDSIKGEFDLKASATTTPGLLRAMSAATAYRNVRVQRRPLGLGIAPAQQKPRKRQYCDHEDTETITEGCMQYAAPRANVLVTMPLETFFRVGILPPSLCVAI